MSLTDIKKIKALRNGLTISTLVVASAVQAQTMDKSTEDKTIQQSAVIHDIKKDVSPADTLDLEQAWNQLYPRDKKTQEVMQELRNDGSPDLLEDLNHEMKMSSDIDDLLINNYNNRYLSYLKKDIHNDKEKAFIDFFEKTHKELYKEKATQVELNEIEMLSFINDEILDYSENTIKTKTENFNAHGKTINPDQYSYESIDNAVSKLTSFDKQNESSEKSKEQNIAFQQMWQQKHTR